MRNLFIPRLTRVGRSALLLLFGGAPAVAMSVSLESFEPAPVSVGTPVTFNASLGEDAGGTVWYRYRVRAPGESQFRTLRDFSPDSPLHWIARMAEGDTDI